MLISDAYLGANAALHGQSATWGILKDQDLDLIKQLVTQFRPQSVLDYGCGKGRLGKIMAGVQSYDPAIPEFSAEPKPADLVVCTAVLEHIEPEHLEEVLDHLKFLTWKVIMLVVDTAPSSHVLSDGRNAHLIQEPLEWWLPKLMERWKIKTVARGSRNFTYVGTTS